MSKLSSSDIPQKEDLDLVLRLPRMLNEGWDTSKAVAIEIGQHQRHASFLLHVGRLLGIAEKRGAKHILTERGHLILRMNKNEAKHYLRALVINTQIISHLLDTARKGKFSVIDKKKITLILKRDAGLSPSTARRRASTICAWFRWLSSFDNVRMLGTDKFEIV